MLRLPQKTCARLRDHDAHDWPTALLRPAGTIDRFRCPGRHTGHGFETTEPIAHPMDADPFAGCDLP